MIDSNERNLRNHCVWFHSAAAAFCFACMLTIMGYKLDATVPMMIFAVTLPVHCCIVLMARKPDVFAPKYYFLAKFASFIERLVPGYTLLGFAGLLITYNQNVALVFVIATFTGLLLTRNFWMTVSESVALDKRRDQQLRLAYGKKIVPDSATEIPRAA
jgi:hypothetical protein